MEYSKLVEQIQAGKLKIIKVGKDQGKPKDEQMLLLVNNKPIKRYIESVCHYAFLDLVSLKITYRPKVTSRTTSPDSVKRWCDLPETLQDVIDEYANHPEFSSISDMLAQPLDLSGFQYDGLSYVGVLPELDAIMLETTSFACIRQIVASGVQNKFELLGVQFPFTMTTRVVSEPIPVSSLFTRWYYGYMAEANVELCAVYWKSLATPKDPYMLRLKKLNEFVPFTIKFSGIFNPFLETEVWERVQRYPFFRGMFKTNTLCAYSGKRLDHGFTDEKSYAMFTNRGILSQIFGFNIAPAQGKEVDWYDPCFFGYVIWNKILDAISAPFKFNCALKPWRVCIKDINDASYVIDMVCEDMPHLNRLTFEVSNPDFDHACVWGYLMFTHPGMTSEWYAAAVPARYAMIEHGLSVQKYIISDIGGDFLGKSQTVSSYRDNQV